MSKSEIANLAFQGISTIASIVPSIVGAIKRGASETKYFKVLPEEYEKEVKLAKERKEYGDTFFPDYDSYLDILRQGRDEKKIMVIKWERKYSKSNWVAHIIQEGEQFNFSN